MGLVIDGHYRQKTYYSSPTCTLRVFLNFFEFKRFPFSLLLLYYYLSLTIREYPRQQDAMFVPRQPTVRYYHTS